MILTVEHADDLETSLTATGVVAFKCEQGVTRGYAYRANDAWQPVAVIQGAGYQGFPLSQLMPLMKGSIGDVGAAIIQYLVERSME